MRTLAGAARVREHLRKLQQRWEPDAGGVRFDTFGSPQSATEIAREIIRRVRGGGDRAVCEVARRTDGGDITPDALLVTKKEFARARREVTPEMEKALRLMERRIAAYAEACMPRLESWLPRGQGGKGRRLGIRFTPLERVGAYVPGGSGAATPLISTALMNVVPARVAGVRELAVATPCGPGGRLHPALLRALELAGVQQVYRAGGAQGIAALALGTERLPRCHKIVGPGNVFVQAAKRELYGEVDIDMMAGPSEIAVLADESACAAHLAADLLAQAEHDALAAALLFTPSRRLAASVESEVARQLETLPRRETARRSLESYGAILLCRDLAEGVRWVNEFAPEHLELAVAQPRGLLQQVRHAGAIFLGHHTPEVVGDYVAGPSHTLPTAGAARFAGGISVYTFLKTSSLIEYSRAALEEDLAPIVAVAGAEGLEAHARSASLRCARVTRQKRGRSNG